MSAESAKSPLDGMTEAEVDEFYVNRQWGACECGNGGTDHHVLELDCAPRVDIGRIVRELCPDLERTGKERRHVFMVCDECRTYWYIGDILDFPGSYEELRAHSRWAAAKLASYTHTDGRPAWWDDARARLAEDRRPIGGERPEEGKGHAAAHQQRVHALEELVAFLNEHDEEYQRGEIIVRPTLRHSPGCPCAGGKKGECACRPTLEFEAGRVPPSDDKAKDNKWWTGLRPPTCAIRRKDACHDKFLATTG